MTKILRTAYGFAIVGVLAAGPGCGDETVLRALGLLPPPSDPAMTHAIPPFDISNADPGVTYERFIALGDMGTGRPGQFEVAAAMVDRANRDGLDFILTLGDNVYENGVVSDSDPQWETKFVQPYGDPALDVPFYPTLGNLGLSVQVSNELPESANRPRLADSPRAA